MRRAILTALSFAALLAFVAAGCGSMGTTKAAPETVIGSVPKATQEPATPALALKGNPVVGKAIFGKAGCTSCHTLADAHSTGTVGPNLDQAKPDYRLATARVTNGKGVMPSFKSQLSAQDIANVAAYVVKSTGGQVP